MAAKKKIARTVNVKRADPKATTGGLLRSPASVLDADEQQLVEQYCKQVSEILVGRTLKIVTPCSVTQSKNDDKAGEKEWRRISMVGNEVLEVEKAYFGKRDGVILVSRAITVPLGLKASDIINARFETPLRHFGEMMTDIQTGKTLETFLEDFIDMKGNPIEGIDALKNKAADAERQRLVREASIKSETYGSNWGAF